MAGLNRLGYTSDFQSPTPFSYNRAPLVAGGSNLGNYGVEQQQGFQGSYNTPQPSGFQTAPAVQGGLSGNPWAAPNLTPLYQQQQGVQQSTLNKTKSQTAQLALMQQQLLDYWTNRQLPSDDELSLLFERMEALYDMRPESEGIYMIGY